MWQPTTLGLSKLLVYISLQETNSDHIYSMATTFLNNLFQTVLNYFLRNFNFSSGSPNYSFTEVIVFPLKKRRFLPNFRHGGMGEFACARVDQTPSTLMRIWQHQQMFLAFSKIQISQRSKGFSMFGYKMSKSRPLN